MVRVSVSAAFLATMTATGAYAADQPLYQPQPAWVRPVPIPFDMKPSGAADMLLWTVQDRLQANDDEGFVEQAIRINSSEGLEKAGSISQVWDPSTDTLTIHRARILRGSQVIDLLAGSRRFTVLRREPNLEAAMIDGALTATLQPEGLQVGDVLDFAYTLARREPALAGRSEGGALVAHAGAVGRLSVRMLWPAGRAFRTWKTDDLPALSSVTRDGWTEAGFDQTGAVSAEPPKGAPLAERLFGVLEVSDFKDWQEVSVTSYPLYDRAAALQPASPLKAEIARIAAASADPKARALAALELVEGQTRYLYVGLNAGGYTPAAADLTWTRRFGDCKGKTVLLLALLRGLGVEAEPALVSTTAGDGLDRRLPEIGAFDHVMIRATLAGKVYWLDGTRMGDQDLDVLQVPNFHWALALRAGGAALEPLQPADPTLPMAETILKIDARAGIDKPATVEEQVILRGDAALAMSLNMSKASQADRDRALRQGLATQYDWIAPVAVAFTYSPLAMEARIKLSGTGKLPFTSSGAGGPLDWLVTASNISGDIDLTRTSDYHRDAPFEVAYPLYARSLVQVELPDGGKGFEAVNDGAINETVAATAYSRTAAVTGARFVMTASSHTLADSFPATQAASAQPALRQISEYPVSLRYTPKVGETPLSQDGEAGVDRTSPADKAATEFRAKHYAAAEDDFTLALKAAPSAKLFYDRAATRAAQGKDAQAEDDLNVALKLDPRHALAQFALGRIELARNDIKAAAERFAAASTAANGAAGMTRRIAAAYEETGHYAEAVPYYDELIKASPVPAPREALLNSRCWTRAEWGEQLDAALQDCDEAIRLRPMEASYLDSRGLVELRLGAFDKSVKDYDQALSLRPTIATSLFGLGVAEARLGRNAQAQADMAAAQALDPKIASTFAKWGVKP